MTSSSTKKKQLLVGYSKKQSILKESIENNGKDVYLTGIFQIFDEKNQNGRIYSRNILEPEIYRYKEEFVDAGRAFGELDHPEDRATIAGDRVCHRIVDLWVEGNNVMGKTLILDTTLGKDVKAMLHNGGVIGVSSRSLGETDNRDYVTDLYLITFDAVLDPSVSRALMNVVNEGKKYDLEEVKRQNNRINEMLRDSKFDSSVDIKEEQKKILREMRKYFSTIL